MLQYFFIFKLIMTCRDLFIFFKGKSDDIIAGLDFIIGNTCWCICFLTVDGMFDH